MIKFGVYRNESEKITRLSIKGHAGFADSGKDIVCAAASTALWMAIKGIEEQALANVSYEADEGDVDCFISGEREKAADAILNSLMLTVFELAKQYRKNIFIVYGKDLDVTSF